MYRLIYLLLALAFFACEEEVATPRDMTVFASYYPLELDRPSFYQVDSIVLVATVGGIRYDTATVEARETLVEEFTGGDGRTVYRGERWERRDAGDEWTFKQTYTVTPSAAAVRRTVDNLTFTKLVQPIEEGVEWDGHTAFDESRDVTVGGEFLDVYNGWRYTYAETDQQLTLSTGLSLDSVITVRQADVDILIDYRQAYERYAPGYGLVESFVDARHTQCNDCCNGDFGACRDLPWDEKAEKGYIIHQTLLRRE